jgi:NTP pyrophosphatase (non-canonical NTP hydrolase)
MKFSEILIESNRSYLHAKIKHADFGKDIVHKAAILAEESGEVVQAALDLYYVAGNDELKKEQKKHLKSEVLDTVAVCFRILEEL